jgi:hypothetical protein
MTEENTNKESAEEKAGNIFSWAADTLSFIKEISKDIIEETKKLKQKVYPTHAELAVAHAFRHQLSKAMSAPYNTTTLRQHLPQPKITEKDFSDQDLKVLKEVLSRPHLISPHPDKIPVDNDDTRQWKKDGYKYIRLTDQPKEGTSVDDKDRELPSSLTGSISGLWYKHNKNGTISIKDRYDFDPKNLSFPNILGAALGARETPGKVSSGNLVDITLRSKELDPYTEPEIDIDRRDPGKDRAKAEAMQKERQKFKKIDEEPNS